MKAKVRILVVDDVESIVTSIAMILDDSRYDVVTAGDGEEAWKILNCQQVDLVVSDYNMPKLNGIGLLLNVRNHPRTSDVPFILMSGGGIQASQEELEEMCVKYGAAFLKKPFSANGLVALLEDAGGS